MFVCLCVERCTAVAPRCSSLHKILTIVISVCVGLVLLGALIAFIVVMLRQRAQKKLQSERIKAKILIGTSEAAVLFFYNLRVQSLLILAMCYVCFAVSLVSRCSRCSICICTHTCTDILVLIRTYTIHSHFIALWLSFAPVCSIQYT